MHIRKIKLKHSKNLVAKLQHDKFSSQSFEEIHANYISITFILRRLSLKAIKKLKIYKSFLFVFELMWNS